jgi:hypothetical protein
MAIPVKNLWIADWRLDYVVVVDDVGGKTSLKGTLLQALEEPDIPQRFAQAMAVRKCPDETAR